MLERPHCARRTHVRSLARLVRGIGQSDDVLLASVRAGDDRNQNAARADQAAKRLARRFDEAVNKDPIEAFPRDVMLESVRPSHRDIAEFEGLDLADASTASVWNRSSDTTVFAS